MQAKIPHTGAGFLLYPKGISMPAKTRRLNLSPRFWMLWKLSDNRPRLGAQDVPLLPEAGTIQHGQGVLGLGGQGDGDLPVVRIGGPLRPAVGLLCAVFGELKDQVGDTGVRPALLAVRSEERRVGKECL